MFDKYFDELQVGDRWRSRGRTITETDLVMFAAFSGDWYPLHTDKEWAAQRWMNRVFFVPQLFPVSGF